MKLKNIVLAFCFIFLLFSCKQTEEKNNATKNKATSETDKIEVFQNRLYALYEKKNFKSLKKELRNYNQTTPESKTTTGIYNLYSGCLFEHDSKMDSAQIRFEKAITNLGDKKLKRELYLALTQNAEANSYMGQFDKAISLRYKALSLLEKSTIPDKEKKHYDQIGRLAIDLYLSKNFKSATSVINNALQNSSKIKDIESISFLESSKASMLFYEERYDESIELSKHALAIKVQLKDTIGQIDENNNIAIAYMGKANWKEAQVFLEKAQSIYETTGKKNDIPAILLNISRCLQEQGKIDLAIEKTNSALQITHKNKQTEESRIALKKLSELYKLKNDPEKALDYYKKSSLTKDTIYNIEKEKTIQELATKYETKQKEEKIVSLQKDKQLANQQRILFLTFIVFLLFIGSGLFAYFHFRNKKNKELLETNQRLYESKLKLNQTELENFTNNLINKSKLIDEMEARLNLFSTNHAEAEKSLKITQLTQMRILTNADWVTFKEHFEKVHKGYIPSIRKKYDNLTPAELRTLLLIKLNMESDEIAAVLGISLISVKTARYRLKKKLGLTEEEDLISFVQNITF
jgi:tetratricopeptide (TPR) repeat protein/DNA-binding CsgD family transcriptional regulator